MAINNLINKLAQSTAPSKDHLFKSLEFANSQAMADTRNENTDNIKLATPLTGLISDTREISNIHPNGDNRGKPKTLKRPADTMAEPDYPRKRARTMGPDSQVEVGNQQYPVDTTVGSTEADTKSWTPAALTEAEAQQNEDTIQTRNNTERHALDPTAESGTFILNTMTGETRPTENIPAKANIQATAEQHFMSNSIPTTSIPPLDTTAESPIDAWKDTTGETDIQENTHEEANIPTATQHSTSNAISPTSDTSSPNTTVDPHEKDMMSDRQAKQSTQAEANIKGSAEEQPPSNSISTTTDAPPDTKTFPYTDQFFADLASTVTQLFPLKAFAASHDCSISAVSQAINAVIVGPLSDPDFHWHEDTKITISTFGRHMIDSWEEYCREQARKKPTLVPALSRRPPASANGKPKKHVRFDIPDDPAGDLSHM
ncbi:hypothetical protein BO94DRAFT_98435 [Aspergillus sclerotioniger CBS 115572]|uniref:Uncharacterized protein n=1 Tax=Aspergillus sclerotioniger CBS 115572 TaxID=1450535 RepID=A0A317WJK0_9EURO|nr:hypothetical protein BO94DRAFT_98435 [Aspergillus sclerotioniger CBS 115572]PWY85831.1 hypothetical protein BO94DRAFT_98435 [Aspergillus sclerotioniger CBS 115572]